MAVAAKTLTGQQSERHLPRRKTLARALICASAAVAALSFWVGPAAAVVNKPLIKPITDKPAAGTQVFVDADKITYDPKTDTAVATGTVKIIYGPYTLIATKVVYDQKNDIFKANGSVELTEPNGNILQADIAEINQRFKEGFAIHVRALLNNNVTITADSANRTSDKFTIYDKASYTACKDCKTRFGQPLWVINTTETIHDGEKKNLYHYNPMLKIGGVPVFYLPYAEQPDPTVTRRTGFLPPSFKHGKVYGWGLVTPYFVTLGDSADFTFTPMITTEQGPVLDAEFRKRTKTGIFDLRAYGVHQFTQKAYPDDESWRGAIASKGEFAPAPGWTYGWDGTLVSDRRFLDSYDFDNSQLITSSAHLTNVDDRTYFNARALHFKTTIIGEKQEEIPYALPYVDSEYTLANAVMGGELSFKWNAYSLHRDDWSTPFATVNHATDQTRATAAVRWQRQMISDIGTVFTPFANARGDLYMTDELPDAAAPGGVRNGDVTTRLLPSAGFDLRMPFIASHESGQSILTPVVQAVAATNEKKTDRIGNEDAISVNFDSTSLFLEDRFTGLDRYEGGARANIGLMYTYLDDDGGFARFSIGESFHLGGDNSFADQTNSGLSGRKSDLVGSVMWQPNNNFSVSYQARLKEDFSKISTQEAFTNFAFGDLTASVGYLDLSAEPTAGRPNRLQYVSTNLAYKLDEAWSVFGGFSYDPQKDRFTGKYAGIAFDCDCMSARLTYSESGNGTPSDPTDRQLRFAIELATIGATSISSDF